MATIPFVKKDIELKSNLVGKGFLHPPVRELQKERVNIIGEIDSASGFAYPSLYIFAQVILADEWEMENETEYNVADPMSLENSQINKGRTSTHISKATTTKNKRTGEIVYKSHFCFPFDYQLLTPKNYQSEEASSTRWPLLFMQVNSIDSWGRHRVEGYGHVTFPSIEGYYDLTVPTWKPKGSLYSQIHAFFLGGAFRGDPSKTAVESARIDEMGQKDVVNRFGMETIASGDIRLKFNILRQSYEYKKMSRETWKTKNIKEAFEVKKLLNEDILSKMKGKMREVPMMETKDMGVISRYPNTSKL